MLALPGQILKGHLFVIQQIVLFYVWSTGSMMLATGNRGIQLPEDTATRSGELFALIMPMILVG